ncbi:MAG: hypothetical protein Q9174_006545, partial [Haloplaca sp. 1 TL-2023]
MSSTTTITLPSPTTRSFPPKQQSPHPRPSQPYSPESPKSGLLTHLPRSWIPYLELTRIDKPAGALFLYFPSLFGTLLAACITTNNSYGSPIPQHHLIRTNMVLFFWSIIYRSAGCTWNDILDRRIDRLVSRTRNRPMARGAVSVPHALLFTFAQMIIFTAIVAFWMPQGCGAWVLPSVVLTALYPYCKRVTNYPQVVLSLVFAWGVILAFPALGIQVREQPSRVWWAAGGLYAANVALTVLYDVVYACQDVVDDKKVGVKSMAVKHGGRQTKKILAGLAVVKVGLLVAVGVLMEASMVYYVGTCGSVMMVLATMVARLDLGKPGD